MDARSLPAPALSTATPLPSPSATPRAPEASGQAWRLSLVLPAYNEEAGIRQAVLEACDALADLTDAYEVLVVDDGSRDGTAALVAELADELPQVRLLRHAHNRGYGAALRTGFAAARYERVAFTDADCQFHLADLGRLLPLSERYPVVAGYREDRQDPWRRRFLSRGYNLLTRTLLGTGVRDCDCALKVFHRAILPSLTPETNTFFVNAEMLARARQQGLAVAEVGVRHRPRTHGQSKVSLWEVPRILATLLPFWWSQVLFPGPDTGSAHKRAACGYGADRRSLVLTLLVLLLVSSALFFTRLRAPFLEPQESRYAEVARQMLSEGSYLVPVVHGRPFLDKPPLLYWLMMAGYALFGVHDWAARLAPGAAGVLSVLVTYLWGRRVAGPRVGLCGALVLCLSAGFAYRARMLTPDSVLCLCVTAGLAAAHVALTGPTLRRAWWLLAAVACGLGILSKGPLALLLVLPPAVAYHWLERRGPRVALRDWLLFAGLALAVAAPWYVRLALVPDFAHHFLWRHNIVRYLAPWDHVEPPWYYLPGLLLNLLPWTLLLPGFARYLGRRSARAGSRRPPALGFFLLSGLWCVVFFSASGSKRPSYIVPALPPLALALGCYLSVLIPHTSKATTWLAVWRRRSRLARQLAALALAVGLSLAVAAGVRQMVKPGNALALAALASAGLVGLLGRRGVSWPACAATTFAVLFLGVYQLLPGYNRQFAVRGLHENADLTRTAGLPVVCYPQRWDAVSFYLPNADVRVYAPAQRAQLLSDLNGLASPATPRTLLVVKSGPVLDDLLRELPASVEFVARTRPGPVTVGWIRRRPEPSSARYAQR